MNRYFAFSPLDVVRRIGTSRLRNRSNVIELVVVTMLPCPEQ